MLGDGHGAHTFMRLTWPPLPVACKLIAALHIEQQPAPRALGGLRLSSVEVSPLEHELGGLLEEVTQTRGACGCDISREEWSTII